MKRSKKHPLTLIEVVIAAALAAVVLATTTQLYYLLEKQARMAREIRGDLFQQRYLQFRLSSLFASAAEERAAEQLLFFSSRGGGPIAVGDSLVFVTDRGPDDQPAFSNNVLARLYRDEKNRLAIAYWPLPSRWEKQEVPPIQKEILMEEVTGLSFSFFSPPTGEEIVVGEKNVITEGLTQIDPPFDTWIDFWEPAFQRLPPIVKMTVEHHGATHTYVAFIPSATQKIVYRD